MKERSFFYYDELDSSMLEYQRLRESCQGLICVRSGRQKDGMGRSGAVWHSPPGGLWFTFDLPYPEPVPSFALFAGYCLHRELSRLFAPLNGKLKIKWTNDIMYEGLKIGGTLCKHHPGRFTVGIGIDDTIHYLNTYRRYHAETEADIPKTIEKTMRITGKAILFTSLALICGFLVQATSHFMPIVLFSLLLTLTMVNTTIGSILLIPAAIRLTGINLEAPGAISVEEVDEENQA